ncbi:hypothetical protein ACFWGV_21850, partial [Bacillus subtilis]
MPIVMNAPEQLETKTRVAPTVLADAWVTAPHPVVVADGAGRVAATNEAVRLLLPAATDGTALREAAPRWLADAHTRLTAQSSRAADDGVPDVVRGEIGERSYEARPA